MLQLYCVLQDLKKVGNAEAVADTLWVCEGLSVMADEQLKQKVYDTLKQGYFSDPDDAVDVSDGPEDSIHLVIFSRKFNKRSMKEKHDLIWSELMQKLKTDEWNKISLSIGASPEEIKAT